jgi:hypothetical protein
MSLSSERDAKGREEGHVAKEKLFVKDVKDGILLARNAAPLRTSSVLAVRSRCIFKLLSIFARESILAS